MSTGAAIFQIAKFLGFAAFVSMFIARFVFVHILGADSPYLVYIILCFGGVGVFMALAYIYAQVMNL